MLDPGGYLGANHAAEAGMRFVVSESGCSVDKAEAVDCRLERLGACPVGDVHELEVRPERNALV
jgi:hypothetical protein